VAAKERENFDGTYKSAFGWMEDLGDGKKGGVDPQFTTNEDETMDDGGGEEE